MEKKYVAYACKVTSTRCAGALFTKSFNIILYFQCMCVSVLKLSAEEEVFLSPLAKKKSK